jgi:hypothetical protein
MRLRPGLVLAIEPTGRARVVRRRRRMDGCHGRRRARGALGAHGRGHRGRAAGAHRAPRRARGDVGRVTTSRSSTARQVVRRPRGTPRSRHASGTPRPPRWPVRARAARTIAWSASAPVESALSTVGGGVDDETGPCRRR